MEMEKKSYFFETVTLVQLEVNLSWCYAQSRSTRPLFAPTAASVLLSRYLSS